MAVRFITVMLGSRARTRNRNDVGIGNRSLPGQLLRRALLQAGFLGIGNARRWQRSSMAALADGSARRFAQHRAEASFKPTESDTAAILLWCGGGPSQLET